MRKLGAVGALLGVAWAASLAVKLLREGVAREKARDLKIDELLRDLARHPYLVPDPVPFEEAVARFAHPARGDRNGAARHPVRGLDEDPPPVR